MTIPDDAAAFLALHKRGFLVTRRRDGSPTIHPMVVFFADGRITMTTYRKSAKARNIERDPRAGVLMVNGYAKDDVRGVLVRGRGALRQAAMEASPTSGGDVPKVSDSVAMRVADRMASGKRIFLDVAPDAVAFAQRLWSE